MRTLTAPRVHLECTLNTPWVHLECTFSAPWVHLEYTLKAPWLHLEYALRAPWEQLECTLSASWAHCESTLRAPWVHLECMGCNVGSGGLAALTNSGSPSRLWQAAECPTGSQAAKPTSRPTHPYLISAKTKIKYGQRQNMIKYKIWKKTKYWLKEQQKQIHKSNKCKI